MRTFLLLILSYTLIADVTFYLANSKNLDIDIAIYYSKMCIAQRFFILSCWEINFRRIRLG